jgi:hypothetical protein
MNKTYLALAAATTLLTLTACSKDEGSTQTAQPVTADSAAAALLAHVPSDSPYVFATIEPVPDDVIDHFIDRFQPAIGQMQQELETALADMEGSDAAAEGASGEDLTHARLAVAILAELDGKLNRPGLQSLGLDLRFNHLLYGQGAFPVFRMGLYDAEVLRETVQRILDKAGIPAAEIEYQGIRYWKLGGGEASAEPVAAYVAILDDHLAFGIIPQVAEAEQLPLFLGLELPAASDAEKRLLALNRKHEYTPHGSGILDLHLLADEFFDPDSTLSQVLAAEGETNPSTWSEVCQAEIRRIIDNTPRMTMGLTEVSKQAAAYQYRLETEASLATQLVGLVSRVPVADSLSERILELSFGMRFGPVRDFLREKTGAIVDAPYQCDQLQDLNRQAANALEQLNQPMPPFLNNFQGLRISLNEIMFGNDQIPENARGQLAVHVEKPEMFVGMAQMFLPDLSEVQMMPGDPPIRLPENLVPRAGMVVHAAISSDAIGMAVGEGEEQALPGFLDAPAGPEGTFLSVAYDLGAYLDYSDEMSDQSAAYKEHGQGDHEAHAEHASLRIAEAGQKAMRDMLDRSFTTMRFEADGLVIDGRTTFR